jgi:hypothetical protein
MFTMAPLLIHSAHVSADAKSALRAALATSSDVEAEEHLVSAAKIIYAETDLDCSDVRELVGLASEEDDDCGCRG